MFTLLSIIVFASISANLMAQNPAGTWVDQKYNLKLVLNGDYSYQLSHPNGQSRGQWRSNGNQFCLYDASGAQPVCYTVIQYSTDKLVLRDVNGIMINYSRQQATGSPSVPGARTMPSGGNLKRGAASLASKGGVNLTQQHFSAGVDLIQFIIGQRIKGSEVQELKRQLIKEFNASPAYIVKELTTIGNAMQTVRNATDPLKIGLVRQQLFTAFYKATKGMTEQQKPLMVQVIHRYIQVLGYDPQNDLVLTNRDIDGYINYVLFNNQLSGNPVQLTDTLKASIRSQLVSNFASMNLDQKRLLSTSSLIWELMDANWKRMSNAQKQQYVAAYRAKVSANFTANASKTTSTPGTSWGGNSGSKSSGGWGTKTRSGKKKSLAEMQREFNAKQNMFRMMQNMNTMSHATSLNIIENMGGTGNYWKVVDY